MRSNTLGIKQTWQKITETTLDLLFWLKYLGNHVANNSYDLLSSLKWAFKLSKVISVYLDVGYVKYLFVGKRIYKKQQTKIAIV